MKWKAKHRWVRRCSHNYMSLGDGRAKKKNVIDMWNDRYQGDGWEVEKRARDLMPFSDVICNVRSWNVLSLISSTFIVIIEANGRNAIHYSSAKIHLTSASCSFGWKSRVIVQFLYSNRLASSWSRGDVETHGKFEASSERDKPAEKSTSRVKLVTFVANQLCMRRIVHMKGKHTEPVALKEEWHKKKSP